MFSGNDRERRQDMAIFDGQKKFGFGLMRLPLTDPGDNGSIDTEKTKEMVDAFMAAGFTYFDTAWMYHKYRSETVVKEALVDRYPRGSYTLATKLHSSFFNTEEERDRVFEEQLRKTGAGYFDYYLIHDLNHGSIGKYEELGCFDFIKRKKEEGLVKHIGFSCHDHADFLDRVLSDHPETEFVQLQINYLDWESEGIRAKDAYEACVKHGVPVVVMEPVKGGTLVNLPPAAEEAFKKADPNASLASWAIRWAASLENVRMVLSGMSSPEQMADNLATMSSFRHLTGDEHAVIESVLRIINDDTAIPCTGCSYCTDGCPMSIPIPKYFSLYNAELQESEKKPWNTQEEYYEMLTKEAGKASDCIGCGQCESICPQHLPIIEDLKLVAERFE